MTAGLLTAVVLTASVFAVTEEEVTKMRSAMPDKPVVKPARPRTMLVFSLCKGFNHSCIPYWVKALDMMAEKTGAFSVEHSVDMAVFTPDTLSRFDMICFNNTTSLTFDDAQKAALMAFITGGKGIVGIHAATDNFGNWPEASHMMGGVFQGHPWGGGGTWAIKIDDPQHPLTKPFAGKGFKVNDEIYRTNLPFYSRDRQRVLMSLDFSDQATRNAEGVTPEDADTGISWIKSVGKGRLFYCSLGHNHHLTWTTPVLEHYLAGIQYAMGDLKVDDSPLGAPAPELDTESVKTLVNKIKEYDWGKSRAELTALQAVIAQQSRSSKNLMGIETLMLPLLNSETSRAVKDFACRELSVWGSEVSVPALAALLDNPETEHMARYALERIPGSDADTAMLTRLDKAKSSNTKIGIITSLGVRRCNEAVAVIRQFTADSDKAVALAAVQALGMIGTPQASAALLMVKSAANPEIQRQVPDALMVCADGLVRDGKTAEAGALYKTLYSADYPSLIRVAALTGMARTNSSTLKDVLPAAVMSEDTVLQTGAIKLVSQLKDTASLQALVSKLSQLPDAAKVPMLAALAANGDPVGRKAAQEALTAPSKEVRIAASQALGVLGDNSSVMQLAQAAAKASDRDEKEAARQALYRLKGSQITAAIELGIQQTTAASRQDDVAAELVRAVAQRGITSLTPLLFKVARDQNSRLSQEALRSIQTVSTSQDISAMADLLAEHPDAATENTAVTVAEKITDRNQRASAMLAKLKTVESPVAKASILRVLGKLGDVNAVSVIRDMIKSDDKTVSEAAFRAMVDWPGIEFLEEMKQMATGNAQESQKVLAFRAYIRMLSSDKQKSQEQIVDQLAEALKLSDRPQEQRLVFSALGAYGSQKALLLAQNAMADPELKAEAEVAVAGICEKLSATEPEIAAAALQTLHEQTSSKAVKDKARAVLNELDKRVGFIISWQISGPYTESGKGGVALFDTVFAPEAAGGQAQWQMLPPSEDASSPWLMNIEKLFTGADRVVYARTVITAQNDTDAVFEIGSDDGVKVWLNGQLVHAKNEARPVVPADDKTAVKLVKGDNTVLMKITQQSGNWGFCLRITNPDGSPMRGLIVKR